MPSGEEAAELARRGFAQAAGDIGLIEDMIKDMKDPEIMKEVEKLMKDKKFQEAVDQSMNSKEWQQTYAEALQALSDPAAMAKMKEETEQYAKFLSQGPGVDGAKDAAMGKRFAAHAAMDPDFMKETIDMLKDPEAMKQVENVMKNPEFMKEMEAMMSDPAMKQAMEQAGASLQELMKDPKAMKEAQEQVEAMMAAIQA
ncbi:unnamed protein product [Discosporangium mesarthrocarpum]